MLIRFSVENFRSFKEKQTLYLSAVKTCKEWITENTVVDAGIRGVRSAVVYGANASGKTNLFIAIERMRAFMLASIDIDKKANFLLCEPFLLQDSALSCPETFEIEFTLNSRHFIYGFSLRLNKESAELYKVEREWLIEVKNNREKNLFLRDLKDAPEEHSVISVNKKNMPQGCGLESRTRPDSLFLTVAAQFAEPTCHSILEYFRFSMNILSGVNHQGFSDFSKSKLATDADMAVRIQKLIKAADLGIKGLDIGNKGNIVSRHSVYGVDGSPIGDIDFQFAFAESQGTQKLFDLSGAIIDTLRNGRILVIDELDAKLHPILMRHIVELFNDPETNPSGAQLIFNAQSPDLLGYKKVSVEKGKKISRLRRDQIFFIEKDNQESSKVMSLIEFKKNPYSRTRNDASYEKDYLAGAYGGIPFPEDLVERRNADE